MTENKKDYLFSETLQDEVKQLLELPHIETLSHHLRRMFIDYLRQEVKTGVPVYFNELLHPLNCLFDFLDVAAKETTIQERREKKNSDEEPLVQLTTQQKIIDFIVTSVSPEKVFLINHLHNEGEKEFFDFVIVILTLLKQLLMLMNKLFQWRALSTVVLVFHFISHAISINN